MKPQEFLAYVSATGLFLSAAVHGQSLEGARNVLSYGAKADGKTLATAAINHAINECSASGGGTVLFPAGRYCCGALILRENVTLQLEAGAVLAGSTNLADYASEPDPVTGVLTRDGLLTARHANNIAVTGRGLIEGNGMFFVDPVKLKQSEGAGDFDKKYVRQGDAFMDPKFGTADGPLEPLDRPNNLLRFFGCTNISITGVTIQNSPIWTVHFLRCGRVNIMGVSINSFGGGRRVPNDDGVDLQETSDVHISDCDIQDGDDGIAVLGGEHVTVANCTLSSRSAAVRVGFAGSNVRDCVFNNLVIFDSNRGISVDVRGSNSIENVLFSDIVMQTRLHTGHWWGKGEPIRVSAVPWKAEIKPLGHIKNVRFRNILADSQAGILVYGSQESVIQDLVFQDVKVRIHNGPLQDSYGGNFDLRGARDVERAVFAHNIPALYCRYVDSVKIDGMEVEWDRGLPTFFSNGIQMEDFSNVEIDGFKGGPARLATGLAAIDLNRGTGVSIRNCQASPETSTFVSIGEVSECGLFVNNDLWSAHSVCNREKNPFRESSGNILPK